MLLENLIDNGFNVKKFLIGFSIILIIIIIIVINIIRNLPLNDFIIVSESLILGKRGSKWEQVKKIDDNILSKKYTIVYEGGKKGNTTINYNKDSNEFFYMDDNYKDLNITKSYAAYTDKFKNVKVGNYKTAFYEDNDYSFINKATNMNANDFINGTIKNSYDLDGDGKTETIYTVTNQSLSNTSSKYSTIFLVTEGKYIGKLDNDTSKPYMVRSIIDLDGDGMFEIIISKGDIDISTFNSNYQIYNYQNGKISKVFG